jgi:asparagine synthase (glutamine-hydrolysing)
MCGIVGIVSSGKIEQQDIQLMNETLAHRGPDAEGTYLEDNVALGHRRLSIIDLDARSNQPFYSHNKRYVMVYNGEIYNYKAVAQELVSSGVSLRTSSDTEVIIEAFTLWGVGFVHKLNGMFAFAIYDRIEDRLYLFRDRVGKKPLFYYHKNNLFLFASELKAIIKHPAVAKELSNDLSTISTFLQLGYIPQPKTFYKDIYKFPAGHYGIVSPSFKISILPFWNISHYITTSRNITESGALTKFKELISDSVHSRLVADVPVGIFLSGGIDSSLVTAYASQVSRLKTFSIGFQESKFDESLYAKQVADHLKTDHQSYLLKEREAVEMVDEYLAHFDEPFADTSAIPTMLVSKLARKEVTVALTGDGGDELFLGYGSYTWARRLGSPWWNFLRPLLNYGLQISSSSRWKRASHLFEEVPLEKRRRHIFSQEQYFFSEFEMRHRLLQSNSFFSEWPYDDFRYLSVLSEAERQAIFDFQLYLRDDLLVKVDRSSMKFGLECRSPLLDHRLAEFAVNLPESLKKRGTTTKYLMRKALFEMVPEKIFNRPKWGFSIPLGQWMKSDLSHYLNYLSEEKLRETKVFNPAFVKDLLNRFMGGEDYLYNRLWAIIIIQKFLSKNRS